MDTREVTVIYTKYIWIAKNINWLCTCLSPSRAWCGCLHGDSFRKGSWWKQSIMGAKFEKVPLWTQPIKCKFFWSSETGLERSDYCQSQVYICVFSEKLTYFNLYVDDYVIVSHKQEAITSLIESLNNVTVKYFLIDKRDISNYLGVNIKKISYGTFKLSQSHLVEKIINHVRL